ncbi:MAG: phosphinothricin N-acetyltransferase [Gemmatimonadota bacterium]|nr:MAG: phosphinothricin N-acetyltransferase [Gemmatimonadota bacterium]
MPGPILRAARETDLPELVAIYNHYVQNTHITFDVEPWTVEGRRPWFDEHAATGPHRLIVAEEDGAVAGYATSGEFRRKRAYATSVESTVYVRPESVGRKLGRALYAELFTVLATEDVHRAYAGIALPNAGSMALHEHFGFRAVGTFQEVGRKFGKYWDVCWLERPIESMVGLRP